MKFHGNGPAVGLKYTDCFSEINVEDTRWGETISEEMEVTWNMVHGAQRFTENVWAFHTEIIYREKYER